MCCITATRAAASPSRAPRCWCEEDQRQLSLTGQLLRGHDLQRLDRREARPRAPTRRQRKQKSGGFEYLHGKSTYSAGIINSVEPDYQANTTYYSVSQDMFGDLTTLTLTYKRGWDRIYKDFKNANGQIVNEPDFGGSTTTATRSRSRTPTTAATRSASARSSRAT